MHDPVRAALHRAAARRWTVGQLLGCAAPMVAGAPLTDEPWALPDRNLAGEQVRMPAHADSWKTGDSVVAFGLLDEPKP